MSKKLTDLDISLRNITYYEANKQYVERNACILKAMSQAMLMDYQTWFNIDPEEGIDWPVAYILLPTGQVSWHLNNTDRQKWDGHDVQTKYDRVNTYVTGE